jgi:hypothetical protein
MVNTVKERTNIQGNGKGATAGVRATIRRGRPIIKVLDAFVTSALKDDETLLPVWKSIDRVRRS